MALAEIYVHSYMIFNFETQLILSKSNTAHLLKLSIVLHNPLDDIGQRPLCIEKKKTTGGHLAGSL